MRLLTTLATIGTVVFWIAMNTAFIRRQIELHDQGRYERGVASFLGHELRRERWMTIYRKGERLYQKMGYTGLILEKIFGEQSVEYHATVETVVRGKLPLPLPLSLASEQECSIRVHGTLILTKDLEPRHLQLDVTVGLLEGTFLGGQRTFFVRGRPLDDVFRVEVLQDDDVLIRARLPLKGFTLTDGFSPTLPIGDFRVGEEFRLPVFDPLGLMSQQASVRVVDQRTEEVQGEMLDVFELRTELHGRASTSLVTEGGDVIRTDFGPPLGIRLEHAKSREAASRGFEP